MIFYELAPKNMKKLDDRPISSTLISEFASKRILFASFQVESTIHTALANHIVEDLKSSVWEMWDAPN